MHPREELKLITKTITQNIETNEPEFKKNEIDYGFSNTETLKIHFKEAKPLFEKLTINRESTPMISIREPSVSMNTNNSRNFNDCVTDMTDYIKNELTKLQDLLKDPEKNTTHTRSKSYSKKYDRLSRNKKYDSRSKSPSVKRSVKYIENEFKKLENIIHDIKECNEKSLKRQRSKSETSSTSTTTRSPTPKRARNEKKYGSDRYSESSHSRSNSSIDRSFLLDKELSTFLNDSFLCSDSSSSYYSRAKSTKRNRHESFRRNTPRHEDNSYRRRNSSRLENESHRRINTSKSKHNKRKFDDFYHKYGKRYEDYDKSKYGERSERRHESRYANNYESGYHQMSYEDMKERYARYFTVMTCFNFIMDILRRDDLYYNNM